MSAYDSSLLNYKSVYLLPRDEQERYRLNTQHAMYRKNLYEGRLIFDEQVRLANDECVLDVGTGTGIWSVELADECTTNIHIDAIDLNPKLFPPQHKSNIAFGIASVTDLPQNWTNRFSFVNQRLLIAGLRAVEWPIAISEIHRVLKPGGSVQLIESISPWIPTSEPSKKLGDLIVATFKENGLMIDCAFKIPEMLKTAGFTNIRVKDTLFKTGAAAGDEGATSKFVWLEVFRGMVPSMRKGNGFGIVRSLEEIDEIFDTLSSEWDERPEELGARIIYAQKAST